MRKRSGYLTQYSISSLQHIIIPKPYHPISLISQPFITPTVCITLSMLAPINFDDQTVLEANEIDDIRPYRYLPLDFEPAEPMRAQMIPKPLLGISHPSAKLLCLSPLHTPLPARPSAEPPSPPRGEGKSA
jgi:hypothetical protein